MSIRDALQQVVDQPEPATDEVIEVKVHELVSRTLFDIANFPDSKVRGSVRRATRAQRIIMDRLVGVRKTGTHPVARSSSGIEFVDLTQGALE